MSEQTSSPAAISPIDCETAVKRLWDYLDGRLPEIAHDEVEQHLATCELCPPHFRFAQGIRDALARSPASLPEEPGAQTTIDELRQRVLLALRKQ
jgi:anti-sigma factor RsiW